MAEDWTALEEVKLFFQHVGVPYVIEEREKWQNQMRAKANGLNFNGKYLPGSNKTDSNEASNTKGTTKACDTQVYKFYYYNCSANGSHLQI